MSDDSEREKQDRFAVLDVFGLKLEVSNPRLAELLTMDYKEALVTDVKELVGPEQVREATQEAQEAVPEVMLTPTTMHDEEEQRQRLALRQRVGQIGEQLGFDAGAGGVWDSPTGIGILTRIIDGPVTLAAATHFVTELSSRREEVPRDDTTVLFVVDNQQSADVFKVAIRQRRVYHLMRTISLTNLETVASLYRSGAIDHSGAVILLTPVAAIDVGEIMSVIRADQSGEEASA